jgi:HlyD family secretion protein
VTRGDIAETVEARGRVAAKQEALLVFSMAGALKAIHIVPGDQVHKGELLAELDAPNLEQNVMERDFNLAFAKLQLKQARIDAERAEEAARKEVAIAQAELAVAQAQYDQTKLQGELAVEAAEKAKTPCVDRADNETEKMLCETNWYHTRLRAEAANAVAQAQLNAARTRLNLSATDVYTMGVAVAAERVRQAQMLYAHARRQLTDTLLIAPFSGIVLSVEKRPGDQVTPYESIGTLADPSRLWVVATVLEQDIDRITIGQPATIVLDAYLEDVYLGTVLQIADQAVIWQGKQAYEVTITFDEGQDVPTTIRMGADVSIVSRAKADVLVIPTQAILMSGGREYVEVVNEDGEIRQVEIETGISTTTETEVVTGLQAGQVIRIP